MCAGFSETDHQHFIELHTLGYNIFFIYSPTYHNDLLCARLNLLLSLDCMYIEECIHNFFDNAM